MYGHREDTFSAILPDYILIEMMLDFGWLLQFGGYFLLRFFPVLGNDVIAEVHALVANVDSRTGDEFAHFVPAFPAERATQVPINLFLFSHAASCKPKVN
jgi:hypothetical protein